MARVGVEETNRVASELGPTAMNDRGTSCGVGLRIKRGREMGKGKVRGLPLGCDRRVYRTDHWRQVEGVDVARASN